MTKLWKKINDLKIRNKLMLIYAVIGFLPVICLFLICYGRMRAMLYQREENSIRGHMTQAVAELEGKLAVYDNLSDYIAFSQQLARIAGFEYGSVYDMYEQISNQLDPMLQSLRYFHDELLQVTIYSENCTVRHDTSLAALSEVEREVWFDEAMESADVLWYVDEEQKTAVSVRRMPLLERMGTRGLLYILIDYDALFSPFERLPGDDFCLEIYSASGDLLFAKGEMDTGEKDKVSFSESCSLGWEVRYEKPRAAFDKAVSPMGELVFLTAVLCVLGAAAIFFFVSFFVTRRIEALTGQVRQVEEGNLEIRGNDDCRDEIGVLFRGFCSMLSRIRLLIDEVYGSRLAQKEYEMKALQNQINPHFLYNTLSMINWKAIEAGQKDISRVTLALSAFYRTSLNKGKNVLTLREELTNVKSYLEIQQMMHDNSFDVRIDVEEGIFSCESLNLILQPLVENAIEHGIDPMEDRRGEIVITGRRRPPTDSAEACIVLTVQDNGLGMDQEKADRIVTEESKGYGVRNVNERIRLYYGPEYALQIKSVPGNGTVCTLLFPERVVKTIQKNKT